MFPDGNYSELTRIVRSKEPHAIEQLGIRLENLGTAHEQLLEKNSASATALMVFKTIAFFYLCLPSLPILHTSLNWGCCETCAQ
jgi:hypothetical protein